jgi:hypothetical protein
MVSFRLNDEIVDVPNDALHISAASYIRQYTHCKASHPQPVAADLQLATNTEPLADYAWNHDEYWSLIAECESFLQ